MTIRAPITIGGMAQLNNSPRRNKFITTDDLATITTAGYLSNTVNTILPTDIFDVFYNYVDENNVGTYAEFTVTINDGVVTLVAASAGDIPDGSVTTPKLANLAVTAAKIANATITNTQIASGAITFDNFQTLTGNGLIGRAANSTGVSAEISVTADGQVLTTSGTGGTRNIVWGTVGTTGITNALSQKFVSTGGSATVTVTAPGVLATDIVHANIEASANAVSIQKVTPTANTITVLCSGDPGNPNTIAWTAFRTAT